VRTINNPIPGGRIMLRNLTLIGFGLAVAAALPATAAGPTDMPLVFEDDFEKGADRWQPTDPEAWRVVETDRTKVYNQFKNSNYKPPHRSPYNISLIKDVLVGDFVLTARVQSTNKGAGAHRDMCLFFHYQDPAHFYYVHLGKRPDPNSSQIMIVNDAPRVMITKNESPGVPWDDEWHQLKLTRRTADGTIAVYFDDMKKPIMVAEDKTFTWGQVGLGSFDDNGNWDAVELFGFRVERPKRAP
jgi:hypothetical protein